MFARHGLRVSLEKTEVFWVGQQNKGIDIRLDEKKLNQRDNGVYLGGAVCGDGGTETDIRRRIQAGANAWRKMQDVMGNIHISRKQKVKMHSWCVTPA